MSDIRQKGQRRGAIQEIIHTIKRKVSKEMIIAVVLIFSILLVGYSVFPITDRLDNVIETPTPTSSTSGPTPTPSTPIPKYSIDMEFVLIPAGQFDMGSPHREVGRYDTEGPVHHVTIPEPFNMSKYEVTQKQWREVMGSNPMFFEGDDFPVVLVSWDDVQEFIRRLNEKEGTDNYRLPSEAEWEYAARAGTTTQYSFGDDESYLDEYAWFMYNSGNNIHPVGQKQPNSWGLYDMHGNVHEWVQDEFHDSYYGAPRDGSAWEDGSGAGLIFRGGCYIDNPWRCRSANRGGIISDNCYSYREGNLGFRLLKEL
ncbi:MAG: formylglycine-generating enzyme family protein [ANME-2 cluster archaeon]|jgi:formylglycine-generating enzyme required for sulfatase activity|nr:formylglycine-generating enzyme family protein [ANME-2 cluster archaeon]